MVLTLMGFGRPVLKVHALQTLGSGLDSYSIYHLQQKDLCYTQKHAHMPDHRQTLTSATYKPVC